MGELRPIRPETDASNRLTCIHARIHCTASINPCEERYSEADVIVIRNFLDTLAEIALAVASRQRGERDE